MLKDTIFFISDAHFGLPIAGEESREEKLYRFFAEVKGRMSTLYILGDFFDFWIEYSTVIRLDYFRLLCALRCIVDSGVEVHYLAGNHDFALGPFFKDQLGITVHLNALEAQLQGQRVYMYHGDGLIKGDVSYRILKKILRCSYNQRIYKLLHPDIGVQLGTASSGSSRKHNKYRVTEGRLQEYRQCAKNALARGHDIVFFGHTHKPEIYRMAKGIYCNTGSWLYNYSYATMCNGQVCLYRYQDGMPPAEFSVNDEK